MKSPKLFLERLLRSNDHRRSRLHDRNGDLVPLPLIFKNGSRVLWSHLVFKLTGNRPKLPWISYEVINIFSLKLNKSTSSILEFGSGMSTLWFVERAKLVCSVENDLEWYKVVKEKLKSENNIEYYFSSTEDEYIKFKSNGNQKFDLILIDGPWRANCILNSLHLINPGGYIYLDNADAESSSGHRGEIKKAVQILEEFSKRNSASIEVFTDFAPTCLFATRGILIKMPSISP